ncbi:MAG: glycoside hydrolase family 25 protein [Clostridia bacterium]|nr:glycoside hydrolase family 25 protein [Clostridia bacterium]
MSESTVAPTCSLEGMILHTCSDCGYEYASDFVAPTGHTLSKETIPPTCTDQGYDRMSCNCGYSFTTNYISPIGHALSVEQTAPACDTEGFKTASCSLCDYSYTFDKVAPLGHDLTVVETKAACNTEGFKTAVCNACEYRYTFDIVKPLGHDFTTETLHVSAKNQTGSTKYTCHCGFSYVGDYRFYSDIFKGAYSGNSQSLAKGIDTYYGKHSQTKDGSLDWAKIKAAGMDFAIIRAGYIGVKDTTFDSDYTNARAAGLMLGAYFYSYADNTEEAKEEALFCLSLLEGKQFEYPIFFDLEAQRLEGLGKDVLTDICVEFISTLQENGYYAALYTNNKWLTTLLHTSKVTTLFDIWYARYPYIDKVYSEAEWDLEKYGEHMCMWQFTETGTIDGIVDTKGESVMFDMNYCYKDYPTLIKSLGFNGF